MRTGRAQAGRSWTGRRQARTGAALTLGAGVVLAAYSLAEARWPVLRRVTVPVLGAGEQPVTVLHLSDLHLTDRTEARVAWVRALAHLHPDVVIDTGDNLSFASGLEPLSRALEPLAHLPGAFVLGDHDYHATVLRSPTRYLRRDPRTADSPAHRARLTELPWRELRSLLAGGGWADLTNRRDVLTVRGRTIELVGVDDPHADRDRYPATDEPGASGADQPGTGWAGPHRTGVSTRAAGSADPTEAARAAVLGRDDRPLRLGLTHAPYRRVLDEMVRDGVGLALAGHTHGGQLCLPGVGTLVTNCDIDRRRARGLSRYPGPLAGGKDAGGPTPEPGLFLHVSAGLGTSPYTPVRVACRPEATLLTLTPAAA